VITTPAAIELSSLTMPTIRGIVAACTLVLLAGCAGTSRWGSVVPNAPMESKCQLAAGQSSLLVTEWSATEKANLEAQLAGGGAVAVAFSGCQMTVLPECRLGGGYSWQRTTPSRDVVEIENQADLYTKLPLGAASLEGELKGSGKLSIETVVAGQHRLAGFDTSQVPIGGGCEHATHIINGMSIGAFVMSSGGKVSAHAGLEVASVGSTGGGMSQSGRLVRSAGVPEQCGTSTAEGPSHECASPLQVFLAPIAGRADDAGPPGSVMVDFVSSSASARWDVYVDDAATCTTPCSVYVDPQRPLVMGVRDRTDKVRIARLDRAAGPVQISAQPRSDAKFVTGLTFTALGGMGVISGIALTGVGCSMDDQPGMCTGGEITLGISAAVTAGAIWLILGSRPRATVRPLFEW